MPIDTPYNRKVTNQYNKLLRDKVEHEEATLQTVMPSPAGMYVNGYEPVMVGSGVGLYKKGKVCPKGHDVCSCGSGSAHGSAHGAGISATLCGQGQYDRVVGGANLGLIPAVRVELALGAGMRGDATSKHGCLDMYQAYNHGGMSFNDKIAQSGIKNPNNQPRRNCPMDMSESSIACREGNKPPRRNAPRMPKKTDGTLYHKSVGGVSAAQHHRHRHLAAENANKNKALRQLGNGEGGRRGRKKPISSKPPAPPKKEEPKSIYTLENLEKGINTAEKVGNVLGKVVPMVEGVASKVGEYGSKAYQGVKSLFGRAKGKAHGKAHGKTRHEIVKETMKKLGCSMIDASKHVKANGLY